MAYHVEIFARQKRVKKLSQYIDDTRPGVGQAPAEMLASLRALQAKGAPMTIRRRE